MNKKSNIKRVVLLLCCTLLLSAAVLIVLYCGNGGSGTKDDAEIKLPVVEYTGTFPGIPDCTGIFSSDAAGVSCRDFQAGPPASPWFTAEAAARQDDTLFVTDMRPVWNDLPGLVRWSSSITEQKHVKSISGSWINSRGERGVFTAGNGKWQLNSKSISVEFTADFLQKQETFDTVDMISLPGYTGDFPYAPGGATVVQSYSLPDMLLQKTELRSRDWELFINASGDWLMTRSLAGDIAEIPGINFDRLSIAGTAGSSDLRWSAGWISKNPVHKPETLLHAVAGNGIACAFSATGTADSPANWRMTSGRGEERVRWGNLKMQIAECSLEGSGDSLSGTIKAENVELITGMKDVTVKIPCAVLDIHPEGIVYGKASAPAEAHFRSTGQVFALEDLSWEQHGDIVTSLTGSSGSGKNVSWLTFTISPSGSSGTFNEMSFSFPGGSMVTSRGTLAVTEENGMPVRRISFSDSHIQTGDFVLVSSGGSFSVDLSGNVSGRAGQCTVTSSRFPEYSLRNGNIEFAFSNNEDSAGVFCRITGTVHDIHGRLANIEAEYFPEAGQWRGRCDFLTAGGLSGIVLYNRESCGWIIPLPGNAAGDFPASIFPGWSGIDIYGIGAFEYDSASGTCISMLNAGCSAGGMEFENARGKWQLATPVKPGGNDLFTVSFTGVNIPGGGAGTFSGTLADGLWNPTALELELSGGRGEFIGIMDGMWLMNFSGLSGKMLAEGFFGSDNGAGWDDFFFSGSGVYDHRSRRWESFSLSGLPADDAAEVRTSVPAVTGNIIEDASSDFFKALLRDCFISSIHVEYSAGSGGVDTDITVRPASPLDFIFSGDPERPFGIPEAGEPGFSGTIEAGIHLPLSGSDGILIK